MDDIYLEANPAFEKMTDLKREDIIGKTLAGQASDSQTEEISVTFEGFLNHQKLISRRAILTR